MGFLILIIIILLIAAYIFLNSKISDFRYRAKQEVLKNTGFSSSDINATLNRKIEKKHLQNFLDEHSKFTEDSIKDLLKQYTIQMFNRTPISEFSQNVSEKIAKDSKLDKFQTMDCTRVNINRYDNSKLVAVVVYANHRDEYNIYLYCTVLGDTIQLDKYQIMKGATVGL